MNTLMAVLAVLAALYLAVRYGIKFLFWLDSPSRKRR